MRARRYLRSVGTDVKDLFVENRMVLSYEEWVEDFLSDPLRQARSAAQYLRDAIDSFGVREVRTPIGPMRRFKLFDLERDQGVGAVQGQEEAQNDIYRILGNFVQAGRVDKLLLLHGPNGAAKSSLMAALMRGLEIYSRSQEGALYRFNWIFPGEQIVKSSIGFGERGPLGELATYAHLEGESVDAALSCEMKDHPVFLIPHKERKRLLEEANEESGGRFILPESVMEGELCHKCRHIYQGLMASYGGDYLQVLRHVQVERFYISRRYLVGAVTLEPELSADASYSQLTVDRSAGQLPPSFQNLDLFSPYGPLVYANRGLLELSDLLKRPLESFKYLLGTTESGIVQMEHFLLHLDQVLVATSDEKQFAVFKETPDFPSFKGRTELVRVPYLRQASVEQAIYDEKITAERVGGKHVAPHATRAAARWAVLTRLRMPDPEAYPQEVRHLIRSLSPMEKLRAYDEGKAPDRLGPEEAKLFERTIPALYEENPSSPTYEGRYGASAREIQTVLLNVGQNPSHPCLTPQAVFEELRNLVRDKSVYEFLQRPKRDGYQDPEGFVDQVEEAYLDDVDRELQASMGLRTKKQQREDFPGALQVLGRYLSERTRPELDKKELRAAEATLKRMREAFGYCETCGREAIGLLLARRYA